MTTTTWWATCGAGGSSAVTRRPPAYVRPSSLPASKVARCTFVLESGEELLWARVLIPRYMLVCVFVFVWVGMVVCVGICFYWQCMER